MAEIDIWGTLSKLLGDICLLLREFVVVSHFTIFPLELLGSAEKPMASLSSSKGKIMRWDTFQISGGKHNCLLLPVQLQYMIPTQVWKDILVFILDSITTYLEIVLFNMYPWFQMHNIIIWKMRIGKVKMRFWSFTSSHQVSRI